ncbi:MAG: HAMP domain-containing protein [Candidatus Omnitrophica bacterium]|nr:HAMP domain-containing protein [Candidatus Omnitrophota bacterium]
MIFPSSLRVRLLLLVVLAALFPCGLLVYTAVEQRRLMAAEVQANALRLARLSASQQERLVEGARQLLITLAELPAVRSDDAAACSALFATLLEAYPLYANFGVIQPDGDIVCSGLPMSGPVNAAHRAYFQRAMETRQFSGGDYQIGAITKRRTINFGYPVLEQTGDVRAVVFAALDLSWLNNLKADAQLPPGGTLTVVDNNGTILARYPEAEPWVGQSIPEAPLIKTILARRDEGAVRTRGLDGVERLYAFAPLEVGSRTRLYVSIGIPTPVAFAGADRMLTRNLILVGIATLFLLAATGVFAELFILRPVRTLVQTAKRLAAGDLSARTGLRAGRGEHRQLTRAFDEMAESLQRRQTELQTAYHQLRDAQDQLIQSEKLASLGQMAAGISHELKNPLGIILMGVNYLETQVGSDGRQAETLQLMKEAVSRSDFIVRGLLDLSRPTELLLKPSDLGTVVEESLASVQQAQPIPNIRVVKDLAPNLPPALADPARLNQVFVNLIGNAVQAMPDGGTLTIRLYPKTMAQADRGVGRRATDFFQAGETALVCEIADTGGGIPKDRRSKLFEPFFTTKPRGQGTGLGLAVSRTIVEAHRGLIRLDSEEGRGTTAVVTLPMATA